MPSIYLGKGTVLLHIFAITLFYILLRRSNRCLFLKSTERKKKPVF